MPQQLSDMIQLPQKDVRSPSTPWSDSVDSPPSSPSPRAPVEYHGVEDYDHLRQSIFDKVLASVEKRFPVENERYRVELAKVKYKGPATFSKKEQKEALLKQKSLQRKLYGVWRLIDKTGNKVLDEREELVAHVPFLTERGTFIRNGNEYTIANQSRLKPGVYAMRRQNGELQSQFNVVDGGRSFKINMDPKTGKFHLLVGGAKLSLFPVLRELGVDNDALAETFGKEEYARNNVYDDSGKRALTQFKAERFGGKLAPALANARLDPEVTQTTLGQPFPAITPQAMLAASRKLLAISKGKAEEDNRDAIHFQTIFSPDDLFAERINRDANQIVRNKLLWKSTFHGKLKTLPGFLTPQLDSVFLQSGLAQALGETNPIETVDQQYRVLRTGEGGIDPDRVTMESRSVQPSHFGVIDPVKVPESGSIGTDSRLTINTLRGNDGALYLRLKNRRGQLVPVNVKTVANAIVAFPGELQGEGNRVRAMVRGKLGFIDKKFVDYELAHPTHMSTVGTNLIPGLSAMLGQRASMGGRFYSQALPLKGGEAPLVQALSDDDDTTFEHIYGQKAGAIRSPVAGRVEKVTNHSMVIQTSKGKHEIELYRDFPFNRLTFLHNTPLAKPGDIIKPGDLLATSNFTNERGELALGRNLRTAYMPWKGKNYEDAIVISESAARKLSSEHLYTKKLDPDVNTQRGLKEFLSLYPGKFQKDQVGKLGDNGVIKVGSVLRTGDPLVLAVRQRPITELHRGHKPGWMDASETWDHESEGVVTDVEETNRGLRISVRSYEPMRVADKLSGRLGDKGVISEIVPDSQMPHDEQGRPMEVLLNPMTIISRTNPIQLIEAALGKVAEKTGKPVKIPAFMKESMIEYAIDQLKKHGLKDTEDLSDPASERKFRSILTGPRFFMKLHHMAEHKLSGRDIGGYSAEGQPTRGGEEGAKRLGLHDINALLSHGAYETLRDAKTLRGQMNNDFWKAFQMGHTPPSPGIPSIYKKFLSHLIGAGVNVSKSGANQLQVMALTDKDIDKLSHGEITEAKGVDLATMKEIPGGLFDKGVTGGHGGNSWSHISLVEPIPNPVMEEPIRRLLGMTQQQLEDVISGKQNLLGRRGGGAIQEALKRVDLKDYRRRTESVLESGSRSKRDNAIKLLSYITMFEKTGLKPEDFVLSKIPVLPPQFRPISATSDFVMKADANALYMDVMKSNQVFKHMKENGFDDDELVDERLNLYKSFKAVTGLGDPINPKLKNQKVQGLLGQVFGSSSPKFGLFQRRVLGGTLDTIGRAVITPNPALNMDQVGLPEKTAWKLYKPFIMRRLTRRGVKPVEALRSINKQLDVARRALAEEMSERPVLINRAPTLHKYNIMAAMPILVKGHSLQVSPLTTGGFNADFDGDSCSLDTRLILRVQGTIVYMTAREFVQEYLGMAPDAYQSHIWMLTDVETLSRDGTWEPIKTFSLHKYSGKMFEIELNNGVTFKVTADHSLMVEGQKAVPSQKLVGKLIDSVALPDTERLNLGDDWDLGYLEGYFVGDGSATELVVSYGCTETPFKDQLQALIKKVFAVDSYRHQRHEYIQVGNKKWAASLHRRFGRYARYKCISDVVFNYSKDYLWGFLAGEIDSDGSVEHTASGSYLTRIWSVSEELMHDLSFVCYTLGIPHALRHRNRGQKSPAWVISIGRDGIKLLKEQFKQKSRKLDKLNMATLDYSCRKTRKRSLQESGYKICAVTQCATESWVFDIEANGVFAVERGVIVHNSMNFHVPVSEEAVSEAKKKMLPSRNLFGLRDFDVHYVPSQEFQHGLFLASKTSKHPSVKFATKQAAIAAYRQGKIDVDTPVEIREKL